MTADLVEHIDHFQRRVLQDALADATGTHWERRAAMFVWARPRPGDFTGRATPEEIAEIDARCAASYRACKARAAVARETVATEWEVAA